MNKAGKNRSRSAKKGPVERAPKASKTRAAQVARACRMLYNFPRSCHIHHVLGRMR